jgi:amino acid transporter, AAT family
VLQERIEGERQQQGHDSVKRSYAGRMGQRPAERDANDTNTLAHAGQASRAFGEVSRQRVPAKAVAVSAALMLTGVVLNYLAPQQVFVYVISVVLAIQLWTWSTIVVAHLLYRRAVRQDRVRASAYRMPGAPYTNYLTLAFFALVAVLLAFDAETPIALYVAPAWFAILAASDGLTKQRRAARAASLA